MVNIFIWSSGHLVIWSSGHMVIWLSGHLVNMVIWSSGNLVIGSIVVWSILSWDQYGHLVNMVICHMSSGHRVTWSPGHLVILSSGLLVIWSFPILWNPVLFLWNTWIICAHSESCFGDLIEQSGYLVWVLNVLGAQFHICPLCNPKCVLNAMFDLMLFCICPSYNLLHLSTSPGSSSQSGRR